MSARARTYTYGVTPGSRTLYRVQTVLRTWIWLGLFILLGIITVGVAGLLSLMSPTLGYAALVVGGLISLIVPGMISRCLYIVPEFEAGQRFRLASQRCVDAFLEAKSIGVITRPVLLGPVSLLRLGKSADGGPAPLSLLDGLLSVYERILRRLAEAGAEWVQIDEPKFKSSIAADVPVTADMAYFRFHGRNAEMWWQGDGETRYKYLYSESEINELAEKLRAAAGQAKLLFAQFNNHWQGYAPRNAVDMKKAMNLPFVKLSLQGSFEEDETD